jgi:TrpR-related protein YerC/YecD
VEERLDELLDAFSVLEGRGELHDFIVDVLSEAELKKLQDRWRAWQLLAAGLTQTEVSQQTGLSRVTVGRAAKVLERGTGMVRKVVERLDVAHR